MARALLRSVLLVLILAASASGWNHTGHRVSAYIAYQQLTPQAKARVNEILKQHPRYEQDLLRDKPENVDPDLWAFMTAATWPDMIRSPAHPLSRKHNKPRWHYINFIFIPPGEEDRVQRPEPPPEPWIPGAEPDNILQALEWCRVQLEGEGVSDADKAIALCWYLHLVGDVHQPLHTVALWSSQFPEGDRGGNEFIVRADGSQTNLHSYWDGLLGGYREPRLIQRVAEHAMELHPRDQLGEKLKVLDPILWARESERLAREVAYLDGRLRGTVKAHLKADPTLAVSDVPEGYGDAARELARRQVALAGYRISAQLNTMFGQ